MENYKETLDSLENLVLHKVVEDFDIYSGYGAKMDTIINAEEELGYIFPEDYKYFLEKYGWVTFNISHLERFHGLGDDIPLEWANGINVIRTTIDSRKPPTYIPTNFIQVYVDGIGDQYYLSEEGNVFLLSHENLIDANDKPKYEKESSYWTKVGNSFSEWLINMINNK